MESFNITIYSSFFIISFFFYTSDLNVELNEFTELNFIGIKLLGKLDTIAMFVNDGKDDAGWLNEVW